MLNIAYITPVVADSGKTFVGQTVVDLRAKGVREAAILAGVQDLLRVEIDTAAERLRAATTTPGAGQAMEYQETQAQAFAALDAPAGASSSAYPMLAASVGLDVDPETGAAALDVLGVARSIKAAYGKWLALGALIRRARLEGKATVSAASTVEDAVAAFNGIAWPL